MELKKEKAREMLKEMDKEITEGLLEGSEKVISSFTLEELQSYSEELEQAQRTRKEQVGDVILAYFKLISVPTITITYFAVAKILVGNVDFTAEVLVKTIVAIWITLVIVSGFVNWRVRKLINLI